MKSKLSLFLFCFHALFAYAQKEGNIWHFGHGAALDFNTGNAVITSPSSMWTYEGSASIADANGNLLFYSNGGGRAPVQSGQSSGKIWNRNHEVMYDMGNTEGGGFSAAQSAVIVPKPGSPNHYYLFTMEELEFDVGGSVPGQPQGRGLSYFEVDMSLNAGLGGVVSYAGLVYTPTFEGLCAIRHTNGTDYWILVHQSNEQGIAVFPVTATGLGAPSFYSNPSGSRSIIKAAPDGKWVTTYTGNNSAILYSFDPSSGTLSNQILLNNPGVKSFEFSPNSQRLFAISDDNEVIYFDLNSPNINASATVVAPTSSPDIDNAQMQLAPDGKIYFVEISFLNKIIYLSTIVCPNSDPFLALRKFAFSADNDAIFFGLPNFDNAIFKQDGDPPLPVNLGADLSLCGPQTVVLDAGLNNANYLWSTGDQTQTLSVSSPGIYAVTVTATGCGLGVDSIEIIQVDLAGANAGPDQTICAGDLLQLDATGTGMFSWSPDSLVSDPGIASPQFIGTESTSLTLTLSQGACSIQDTLQITVNAVPTAQAMPADTTIIAGQPVQLTGMGPGNITWSPAEGLSCTGCPDPIATPTDSTLYVLTITNAAGCQDTAQVWVRTTPPDCLPDLPNAFTPNGDGANDVFQPIGQSIESFDLAIYNRWGQQVYLGNQPWDGMIGGQPASSDVYVYRVNIQLCGGTQSFSNELTLLR